jgi:hypothetical protein
VHTIQFLFLDSPAQARASMPVEPLLPGDVNITPSFFPTLIIIAHPVSRIQYPISHHTPIGLGHKRFFERPAQKMG